MKYIKVYLRKNGFLWEKYVAMVITEVLIPPYNRPPSRAASLSICLACKSKDSKPEVMAD